MAEITRQDLISDEALQAPAILTKELEKLLVVVGEVKNNSKQLSDQLGGGGLKSSQESTKKLTDEQRVLATVSKQIATETAKQSAEYQKQVTILKDLKEQQKQRNTLGEKEAINVRASNSSLKELEAALKANRAAYSALRSEQERNSETGKQLKEVIQQQYAETTKLNKEQGIHKDTVGDYEGAMRRLKLELKAAKDEMVGIAATLGEDSQEFKEAAAKAGQLADQVGDIQQSAKAVSGTPIENFAGSFQLLQDKIKGADFKGAASAINGISGSVKQLSFKEATNGLSSFGSAIGGLGKALFTNPIFLIAAAIAAAVITLKYFESEAEKITTNMLERGKREMDALTERYDHEIKLKEIAGKQTYEIELEKQRAIIKTADTAIKSAGDIMKIDLLNSLLSRTLVYKANEEKIAKLKEFNDAKRQANLEIELIEARQVAAEKKRQEELQKVITDSRKKIQDKIKEILKEAEPDQAIIEFVDPTELFLGKDVLSKVKSKLEEVYAQTDKALKEQYDAELNQKVDHHAKMLETDMRYKENRRRVFREMVNNSKEELQEIQKYYQDFSGALLSLSSNLTQARIQDIDSEINKEKERANEEIVLAGGNVAAKEQITAQSNLRILQLEKKKREEQRKFAEQERAAAIIEAGIKGALAVLNQLSGGDPLTAIPRSILAGALAGIQIAAIISKPLPQYFKGTDNHPGGRAIVGEQGVELMRLPSGDLQLTPSSATVMDLPKGTEVIPNAETMRMLAMAGITRPESLEGSRADNRLIKELKELKEITAKNSPTKSNLTRNMATVYESRKVSDTMTQKVRALSMGEFGL
jgi:hypothetical protein